MLGDSKRSYCLVFPHSAISERNLKRLLALFEAADVALPWDLDPAEGLGDSGHLAQVTRFLRPLENVRPGTEFPSLLKEYKTWAQANPGLGCGSFLKAATQLITENETKWEIRDSIKNPDNMKTGENKGLQAHLVLHLYAELDKDRRSTEDALESIKAGPSPLQDALGEDQDLPGLFDDFNSALDTGQMNEARVTEVINAWLELFSHHLPAYQFLVTFDSHILDFVAGAYEEASAMDILSATELPSLTLEIPDLSAYSLNQIIELKSGLADEQEDFFSTLRQNFPGSFEICQEHAGKLQDILTGALKSNGLAVSSPSLNVTVKRLPEISEQGLRQFPLLALLAGKFMILLNG